MYGPVYDGTGFQYFINICSQKHSNVSCIDEDGKSIDALACQVLNNCPAEVTCTGKNLGMVAGYYPLDASQGTQGFVLEYTGGDPGCDGMFRSVNVTFLCTPDAGVGFPAKPDDKEEIEGPGCHYDFTWRSLYGCPVCTERDYSYYYTECKDNKRRKVYFWNENPRACHDGVALPADEIVPTNCSTQTICAEGKYVDGLTGACVDCPEGTYSVGPGSRYESFTEVPAAFTNRCGGDSSCLPFRARNGHLISGYGAESVLRYTATFVMEGSVSFDYSLYLPSPADAVQHDVRPGFEFSVDGVALLSLSNASIYGCAQFTHDLTAGGHVLEWRFTGADSRRTDSEDFAAVELHSIVIRGDKYSPLSCTPCPAGYFQASTGAAACTPCPTGTVVASPTAATKCVACGADEYSFDGVACQKRPECTAADWEAIYGPCIAGKASRAYVKLAPTVCTGGSYVPPSTANETVDCPPCPPGTARKGGDGECVGCSNGLVAQEKNGTWTCVETAKGHAAVYSSVFFGENDTAMAELPQGWETSGLGWRVRTGYVDSGVVPVASTPMKSFLTYKTEIVVPQGSVSFDVACSVPRDRNIFLFVNNQRFPLSFLDEDYYGFYSTNTNTNTNNNEEEEDPKWTPFTVPVERGPLELTWVSYYARADTVSASVPKFRLRNVRITGVAAGGESASQQCPAGTEASAAKTACEPCPAGSMSSTPGGVCEECYPGTFSNTPGAVACDICYAGTSSELPRGSTRCVTACVFSVGPTETYNLTLLGLEAQGPLHSADGSRVYLSVCSGKFPEGVCGSSANTSSSGFHVCRVASDGVAYDNYGTNLKFVPSGVQNHFALDFLDGAKTVPGGVPRSTRINFACNVNIGTGYPILEFANESHLEFSWVSYIACRNCVKETDYERVVGKCKNSKAKVELVKKGECYGPSVISEADEKCKDVVVPIVVPVVSGIILVLLVVVIALVIYRNRVITTKYENLRLANPLLADEGGLMEDISESKDSSIVN